MSLRDTQFEALFGAKSEKNAPEQYELALEDIEAAMAVIHAEDEEGRQAFRPSKPCKVNQGALSKCLPRIEAVIEPEQITCGCAAERHAIGEDVSGRRDIIPARFRVTVTRRPKYACRSCGDGIVQAPVPARLIPGGLPTEAIIAHVIVRKYADHLPLYRQAQIYSRQGIELDRSKQASWVGKAAFELRPVFDAVISDLKRSKKLFMDETVTSALGPGRSSAKTATSGLCPAMTALGAVGIRQAWLLHMHRGDPGNMRKTSCRASAAFCRSTVMPDTTAC